MNTRLCEAKPTTETGGLRTLTETPPFRTFTGKMDTGELGGRECPDYRACFFLVVWSSRFSHGHNRRRLLSFARAMPDVLVILHAIEHFWG
jgi:hypothetical protein